MKKFEFTGETKIVLNGFDKIVLHRIKALVRIESNAGNVEVGDIGGWIEKEGNLSHDGNAWVYGDAEVYGNAEVYGDARVYGNAEISGNARIYGNARICGNAWVYGDARVYGNAEVWGNAWVYGDARVWGNAWVYGDARIYGNAGIYGNAEVWGNAEVCGNAEVWDNARIWDNAEVFRMEHYLVTGPIGSRNAFTTFFRTKDGRITVVCGCFFGTIDEFLAKVKQTHGNSKHAKVYQAAVEVALAQLEDVENENIEEKEHDEI